MAEYRTVNCKMWEDDWFHELDSDSRVLWTWLITNHRTSVAGFYPAPIRIVAYETGLEVGRCTELLQAFEEDGKIH